MVIPPMRGHAAAIRGSRSFAECPVFAYLGETGAAQRRSEGDGGPGAGWPPR